MLQLSVGLALIRNNVLCAVILIEGTKPARSGREDRSVLMSGPTCRVTLLERGASLEMFRCCSGAVLGPPGASAPITVSLD